jgi:DNA polymerase-3 subunit beta
MNAHIEISMSPAILAAVAPFMATKDVRYYLNGVCLQARKDGGITAVATDGHALCAAHDAGAIVIGDGLAEPGSRVLIPRDFVLAVIKHAKKDRIVLSFRPDETPGADPESKAVTALIGNVTLNARTIVGRYPDWQAVIPHGELTGEEATFNPDLIAKVCKAADGVRKHGGVGKWLGMKLVGNGPDRSAVFVLQGLFTGLAVGGVIMPLRHEPATGRDSIGCAVLGS